MGVMGVRKERQSPESTEGAPTTRPKSVFEAPTINNFTGVEIYSFSLFLAF